MTNQENLDSDFDDEAQESTQTDNQDNFGSDEAQASVDQLENVMPDGIGLSLESVRALLAKEHSTLVAKDDPMLMVATLLNSYLSQVETQNNRLQKGMTKLLEDKTDSYVKGVQAATDSLASSLSTASVEAIKKIFTDNAAQLIGFKNAVWLVALVVIASAMVNVVAFAALALR